MRTFKMFQTAIDKQFQIMSPHPLFRVAVTKEELWQTYLDSFPEGSNPLFRERTEHDCSCCRHFVYRIGAAVAIINGKPISVWDTTINEPAYQAVADAMAKLIYSKPIAAPFYDYESTIGVDYNLESDEEGRVKRWEHFCVQLPNTAVKRKHQIPTLVGEVRTTKQVFERALDEITLDAIDTVLELIAQGSLYRGEEKAYDLEQFRKAYVTYYKCKQPQRDAFLWGNAVSLHSSVSRIKNTSLGVLLIDLSEGKELDHAVGAYEKMVAPENYKRPTALITKGMIKKAQEKVEALGLADALERRYAAIEDITINNVLFADRDAKKHMTGNVFDELVSDTAVDTKKLGKVEEINIHEFIDKVVPKAEKIELLVDNKHQSNFMSLIAPSNPDAPLLFKWDNNFCWSYNGEVADSMIKERVKAAGGDVTGVMRFSIQWNAGEQFNNNDYDAWCVEPNGNKIYFGNMHSRYTEGRLDVDIRLPRQNHPAVENITFPRKDKIGKGQYSFIVHNYSHRGGTDGFSAEFEFGGEIRSYVYSKNIPNDKTVEVLRGTYDGHGFTVTKELPSTVSSKEIWGINTMQFHRVKTIMFSPNHWDGNKTGNRHYFFIIDGCKQEGMARGFYNEFLRPELNEHRKVFEVLGSKMRVAESDNQLSGLGFSTTKRNEVYCRVSGKFTRNLKIIF